MEQTHHEPVQVQPPSADIPVQPALFDIPQVTPAVQAAERQQPRSRPRPPGRPETPPTAPRGLVWVMNALNFVHWVIRGWRNDRESDRQSRWLNRQDRREARVELRREKRRAIDAGRDEDSFFGLLRSRFSVVNILMLTMGPAVAFGLLAYVASAALHYDPLAQVMVWASGISGIGGAGVSVFATFHYLGLDRGIKSLGVSIKSTFTINRPGDGT